MNNLTIIITYLSASFFFMILVYALIYRRRKRHAKIYAEYWGKLEAVIEREDSTLIDFYGEKLMWNESMERKDYIRLKDCLDKLVKDEPKLQKFTNEVHKLFEKKGWLAYSEIKIGGDDME